MAWVCEVETPASCSAGDFQKVFRNGTVSRGKKCRHVGLIGLSGGRPVGMDKMAGRALRGGGEYKMVEVLLEELRLRRTEEVVRKVGAQE